MISTRGIFPRVLMAMALVAVVPLGINWYVHYQATVERLSEQVEQELGAQTNAIAIYVDSLMEMNLRLLRQNAMHDDIVSMNPARQTPILRSIAKEYDGLLFLAHTIDTKGTNIARSDNETLKNFADRTWFPGVMKGPYGTDVQISRSFLRPSFALGVPIMDRDGKVVGGLLSASYITDLSKLITSTKIGETGYAYLLSDKGKVLAHHKKEFAEVMKEFSDDPALIGLGQNEKKRTDYFDESTRNKVVSFAQRTKFGWIVIVRQNYDEAFAPVARANMQAFLVLLAAIAIVVAISYFVARHISQPILNVAQVADRVSRGDLSVKSGETKRNDEIGELARAVDRLAASVRVAMEHMARRAA